MFRPVKNEHHLHLEFSSSFAKQYNAVPAGTKHIAIFFNQPPTGKQLKEAIIAFPKTINSFSLSCDLFKLTAEEVWAALVSTPPHVKLIELFLIETSFTDKLASILAKIPRHVEALYLTPITPIFPIQSILIAGMEGIPSHIKTLGLTRTLINLSEVQIISLLSCTPDSITTLDISGNGLGTESIFPGLERIFAAIRPGINTLRLSDNSFKLDKNSKELNEEAWIKRFDKLPGSIAELIFQSPHDPNPSPFSFYHEIRQARMRAAELVADSIPAASLDVLSIVMQYATSTNATFWKKRDGKSLVAATERKEDNPALMKCIVR